MGCCLPMLRIPFSLSQLSGQFCPPRHFSCIHLATPHARFCDPTRRSFSTRNSSPIVSEGTSAAMVPFGVYNFIEDIEPLERYVAGGYYPVRIGDKFCSSRYEIVYKLGYGASSTTWLAYDMHSARYVAIKFTVSALHRPFESAILRSLRDKQGSNKEAHAGMAFIPEILDEFEVEGPEIQGAKGKHKCLVTEPAGMSISDAREASPHGCFQPLVARAIAAQLILAVAFMHARGFVHAGKNSGWFCRSSIAIC